VKAGKIVKLKSIDSVATSLGALSVVNDTLNSNVTTKSFVVTDTEAVNACYDFANEYRVLVEPACGAALALTKSLTIQRYSNIFDGINNACFIVCGGSAIDLNLLEIYKNKALEFDEAHAKKADADADVGLNA